MLELYQLTQLIAIAECGTMSGAAGQLHLSQPALSRSMQKLEEELQVTLFDRKKNKIALNQNGELAVQQARRVVQQAQDPVSYTHLDVYKRQRPNSLSTELPCDPV